MFHKLVFRKRTRKKVYLKRYLSNTPNTVDQIQIQIQIHGLKFDQIQIQIRRICICICICICKYKYVFDPSLGSLFYTSQGCFYPWTDIENTELNSLLCIMFIFPTRIFCRAVSDFMTRCPCDVWRRGLTTCPLWEYMFWQICYI